MKLKGQNIGMKGIYKLTLADVSSPEAQQEQEKLSALTGRAFEVAVKAFNKRFGIKTLVLENVTCDAGRTIIAKALSGNIAAISEISANYIALGTDATAPASDDTTLGTETFRKLFSSRTYADNYFYGTGFFAAGEGTGTLEEVGVFVEGTGSADTGSLLSHLALSSLVKGAPNSLTLEVEIQINDA